MITIMDSRIGYPIKVDSMPIVDNGYIFWRGECRYVLDMHVTKNGTQIELMT